MAKWRTIISSAIATALVSVICKADVVTGAGAEPLTLKVPEITGKEVDLAQYKGQVVMIVNVASKCGLTPQYEKLQALYAKYKDKGFVILGFPANNFGGQEPGTNDEIQSFCTLNYGVDFPMFAKVSVKGEDKCPLYTLLTDPARNGEFGGEILWNFTKFLVGKDGKVVARFEPKTAPDVDAVSAKIEEALGCEPKADAKEGEKCCSGGNASCEEKPEDK